MIKKQIYILRACAECICFNNSFCPFFGVQIKVSYSEFSEPPHSLLGQ